MPMISAAAVAGAVAGAAATVASDATGWTTPQGLASFIVALTGFGALVWSITSARKQKKQVDLDAALELIKATREADRDD